MQILFRYLRDSVYELKLVTWPSQDELLKLTFLTIGVVIVSSVFLGLADLGFTTLYRLFLTLVA